MEDNLLDFPPYALEYEQKKEVLGKHLLELTRHHYENCPSYRKILDCMNWDWRGVAQYEQMPYLPVRLFKELELRSCSENEIVKTMTSSGTSGQAVSKIFLDRDTSNAQQKALVKIVSSYMGANRLPMLIIDSKEVLKNRQMFSARGAGILGFSMFGTDKTYALDEQMHVKWDEVEAFLLRHAGEPILLFGFTYIVWQEFYEALKTRRMQTGKQYDLSKGIFIHGGGWKKLQEKAVSQAQFREALKEVCGITKIHDYYGMVEQTGCIYMQCEQGHFHTSMYSEVLVRNPHTLEVCKIGEEGLIQVLSGLPKSYPGHSILTEDVGVLLGGTTDVCPCGRKGTYFALKGRLKHAELRGCSDTYAERRTNPAL
jgi:phenylacetate-coenzyme A ligase PaaK-like adenylate-forming protein